MKTRTWFLMSLLFLLGAAIFWRLEEGRQRALQPPSANALPGRVAATKNVRPPALMVLDAKAPAASQVKASIAGPAGWKPESQLPEDRKYPLRLRNTTKSIAQLIRSDSAIILRNALLDTKEATPVTVPEHLRATDDPGSYIVQARGAIDKAFRDQLTAVGAEFVSYVPNNAYHVRVSAAGANRLAAMPRTLSVMPFEPYYKLADPLLKMAVNQTPIPGYKFLNVVGYPGGTEAMREELTRNGQTIMKEQPTPFGPQFTIAVKPDSLVALAQSPNTQTIEPFTARKQMMDLARSFLGTSGTTNGPNYLDLSGTNVLVAVVDTGVDAFHPDLFQRVVPVPLLTNNLPPSLAEDLDGHGTFIAGIIAGSGASATYPSIVNVSGSTLIGDATVDSNFRGIASQAKIYPLPIGTFYTPQTSTYQDTELQRFIAQSNISIANLSWGVVFYPDPFSLTPVYIQSYDTTAASYDQAVRDSDPYRTDSRARPVSYVVAAGNLGFGSTVGIDGNAGTIISPATAKNVITVSALEQPRLITNQVTVTNIISFLDTNGNPATATNYSTIEVLDDTDSTGEVAAFASRGNVEIGLDGPHGRFKPDLVAPGQFVVSTATTSSNGWGNANMTNFNPLVSLLDTNIFPGNPHLYRYESGTSVAAAMISGMLALMQEFFEQKMLMTNSPALMKALLINGARSTGLNNYDFCPTNLVTDQGWGRPFLSNSIPPMLAGGLISTSTWPMVIVDQEPTNALATGHSRTYSLNVLPATAGQEEATNYGLRFTLVWTDPPGNPNVGVKLVNDLDLVVFDPVTTNYYFGNNFPGQSLFVNPMSASDPVNAVFDTNTPLTGTLVGPLPYYIPYMISNSIPTNLPIDFVNNVENVFIDGPISTNYLVTVFARRVNVNAVSENTNNVVQDYALVISSENTGLSNIFAFNLVTNDFTNRFSKVLENGKVLQHERAGANFQLRNPTNGVGNQWNFYIFTNQTLPDLYVTNTVNDPITGQPTNVVTTNSSLATGTNVAFILFRPANLAKPRVREADIDLFVTKDPDLNPTNLIYFRPLFDAVINNTNSTVRSVGRGGSEVVLLTNGITPLFSPITTNDVFYVGVKSEDQQAADYSILVISTDSFAETNAGGVLLKMFPLPSDIPDGSPDAPGGVQLFGVNPYQMTVDRVVVTNFGITHEDLGDLVAVLDHDSTNVVLLNHSLNTGTNIVTNLKMMFDDRRPELRPDGPGAMSSFIGNEGIGVWLLTVYDNTPFFTGRVETAQLQIYKQTNSLSGNNILLNGGEAYVGLFYVPLFATNMVIDVSYNSGSGPLDMYLRLNNFPPPFTTNFDMFDQMLPQQTSFTNDVFGTYISPSVRSNLASGYYYITLINTDLGAPVSFNFNITFGYSLAAADSRNYSPGTLNLPLTDNATTSNTVFVSEDRVLADVTVGVNIEHPQISDLVLHLVSPSGTRVLLYENRGAVAPFTSVSNLNVNFSEDTNLLTAGFAGLVPIKFAPVPYTNVITPPQLDAIHFFGGNGDQDGTGIGIFGNGAFISGTTVVHAGDGMAVRFDLPITSTNGPVWLTNWPGDLQRGVLWFSNLTDTVQIAGQTPLGPILTIEAVIFLPSGAATTPPDSASGFAADTTTAAGNLFTENGTVAAQFKDALFAAGPDGIKADLYNTRNPNGPLFTFSPLSLDTWHHVAFSMNGIAQQLFIDGIEVATDTATGSTIGTNSALAYLGALLRDGSPTESTSFLGFVDSFRITTGVARYTGTGFTPPLGDMTADANTALLYNFNQPVTDSFVQDLSGNGRDGLLGVNPTLASPTRPAFARLANAAIGTTDFDAFYGVTVTDEGVYMVGESKSIGTNATGAFASKAVVVKYPFGSVNGVFGPALNGTLWHAQLPSGAAPNSPTAFDGTSVFRGVASQKENGVNFIYATGYAEVTNGTVVSSGFFSVSNAFVAKLDTSGNTIWTQLGTTPIGFASGGNAIVATGTNIWVAGVTNTSIGQQPMLLEYDPNGVLIFSAVSGSLGTYNGLVISGTNLYAVGSVNNGPRKKDWLMERWIISANGIGAVQDWSQVVDSVSGTAPGIVGSSDDDELFGVTELNGHVYATGYMIDASQTKGKDLVLIEIAPATGGILSTAPYGGSGDEVGRGITNDGDDVLVVGQSDAATPIPRAATGSSAPDFFFYDTGATSGTLTVNYDFFGIPDSMHIYLDGNLIYDSGLINGNGVTNIPYASTNNNTVVTIVMNETGGYIGTAWIYSVSSLGSPALGKEAILLKYRVKNAYLPEEPLSVLNGEGSLGNWTLEVTDSRLGPDTNAVQTLVSWTLKLTYAPTNLVAPLVFPSIPFRVTLSGSQPKYMTVNVPAAATLATNAITADRSVQVVYNATEVPRPGAPGNFTLLPGTANGKYILSSTTGTPRLKPGKKYYLSVQNVNPNGPINNASFLLTFDKLFEVSTLTSGVNISGNINSAGDLNYYQFTVPSGATAALFDLHALSGNADLYLRKSAGVQTLPSATLYDYRSMNLGSRDDRIYLVPNNGPVPLTAGVWYLGVQKPVSANVTPVSYQLRATAMTGAAFTEVPLNANTPLVGTTAPGNSPMNMYRFNVPASSNAVLFEIINVTGADANLVLRRASYPTPTAYDLGSFYPGHAADQIVLRTNSPSGFQALGGTWYLGVYNSQSTSADFKIRAAYPTNGMLRSAAPLVVSPEATFNTTDRTIQFNWNALTGERYRIEYSTDLIHWTLVNTIVAPAGGFNFNDAGLTNSRGFYRIIQVP